jgi:Uma2 family endonuclease
MTRTMLTYRDYEALPNDGRRYEIHDGELSVTPAPSLDHQIISMRLIAALLPAAAAANGLLLHAPLDVILADTPEHTSIAQPDLVYLGDDRRPRASPRGIEGAPTLVVEIVSPSTRTVDRVTKRRLYARHRVPYLWLVDPVARAVEVLALEGDRYVLAARTTGAEPVDLPPFDGLALVPDALWP